VYLKSPRCHDISEGIFFLFLHNFDEVLLSMPFLHQVKDWLSTGCLLLEWKSGLQFKSQKLLYPTCSLSVLALWSRAARAPRENMELWLKLQLQWIETCIANFEWKLNIFVNKLRFFSVKLQLRLGRTLSEIWTIFFFGNLIKFPTKFCPSTLHVSAVFRWGHDLLWQRKNKVKSQFDLDWSGSLTISTNRCYSSQETYVW
jgi:hypothetical protein